MTAAHRSRLFGSQVTVTSRSTRRSVTVRINDRGPFVKGRWIDPIEWSGPCAWHGWDCSSFSTEAEMSTSGFGLVLAQQLITLTGVRPTLEVPRSRGQMQSDRALDRPSVGFLPDADLSSPVRG
ncbi:MULTISPECIES: RlpA-like double-psi beta-barrel domain-containing protein [unclassified Bradyrhizobium]